MPSVTGQGSDQAQQSFGDSLAAAINSSSDAGPSKGANISAPMVASRNGANVPAPVVAFAKDANLSTPVTASSQGADISAPVGVSANSASASTPVVTFANGANVSTPVAVPAKDANISASAVVSANSANISAPMVAFANGPSPRASRGAKAGSGEAKSSSRSDSNRAGSHNAAVSQASQSDVQVSNPIGSAQQAQLPIPVAVPVDLSFGSSSGTATETKSSSTGEVATSNDADQQTSSTLVSAAKMGQSASQSAHLNQPADGSQDSSTVPASSADPNPQTSANSEPVKATVQNGTPDALQNSMPSFAANALQSTDPAPAVAASKTSNPNVPVTATSNSSHDDAANAIQAAIQAAVSNPIANTNPQSNGTPISYPSRDARASAGTTAPSVSNTARGTAGSTSKPAAVSQLASQTTGNPERLPSKNVLSGDGSNQSAQSEMSRQLGGAQPSGDLNLAYSLHEAPATAASSNTKDVSKQAPGTAEVKHDSQSTQSQADSQTSSQDTSYSSQNQSNVIPQDQVVASTTQPGTVSHSAAAVAQTQSIQAGFTAQGATTQTAVSTSEAKLSASHAQGSIPVPQAQPVINSAKLIQTMGQSEMRVGMRSTEFGNISISTSSTKDAITAQISLDHGELAKALAAHLPEIQARMGANQPVDVRIDMHGNGMGQGTGTQGGFSNGSADTSQRERQQASAGTNYGTGSVVERQTISTFVPSPATVSGGLNARLDITV